jgi:hypothetical protein
VTRRSSITAGDLCILLAALQNRADAVPLAGNKAFRSEIETVICFSMQLFGTDPAALNALDIATSKLVLNQPGAALDKIESVLVRRGHLTKKP